MKNILVLCTGNSCRSQIANGWLNYYTDSSKIQIYSAGIEAHGLNKMAVETMSEIGIDISHQKSNLISDYDKIQFDFIITVCDMQKKIAPFSTQKIPKKFIKTFLILQKLKEILIKLKTPLKKAEMK